MTIKIPSFSELPTQVRSSNDGHLPLAQSHWGSSDSVQHYFLASERKTPSSYGHWHLWSLEASYDSLWSNFIGEISMHFSNILLKFMLSYSMTCIGQKIFTSSRASRRYASKQPLACARYSQIHGSTPSYTPIYSNTFFTDFRKQRDSSKNSSSKQMSRFTHR